MISDFMDIGHFLIVSQATRNSLHVTCFFSSWQDRIAMHLDCAAGGLPARATNW